MQHEISQEQAEQLGGIVVKVGAALGTLIKGVSREHARSHALFAAVAYHDTQNDKRDAQQIIDTADQFENYIVNGKGF